MKIFLIWSMLIKLQTFSMSVLNQDERQAILNNVIQYKPEPTPAFDGQVVEEVSVPDIDEGEDSEPEDRADPLDTNKFSLNVIDVSPLDTQLAHSVLIVHKPKPNNKTKSKVKPSLLIPQIVGHTIVKGTIVTAVKPQTSAIHTTTTEIPVPVRDNHKPLFLRPFPGRKKTTTTSTTTTTTSTTTTPPTTTPLSTTTTQSSPLSFKFTPSTTSIHSATASTYSQAMNISFATTETEESDDYPIVFHSNHKKQGFTRQKLTSTEYALIFTTPDSLTDNDNDNNKATFSEVPTVTASSYTMRPPYVTTLSQMKRPPMKIMTVNANHIKQPEEIYSEGITVLDPPFVSGHPMKLPPNTTIIHKNLIVPMKDGRPKPMFPMTSTTQFPVYPIVAGITKWHTSPTTPWALPLVTTTSPDQMINTFGTTSTDSDNSFAQSVTHPTMVTAGQSLVSSPGQTTHLVTVTPIKSTSHQSPSASSTFVVTHSAPSQPSPPPRPSTTTPAYVNAIWAPPMPITRPVQSQPTGGSWYSPIANIFSYDPSSSSMLSFMGIMRTILFTVLVFALPPLTLALALLQVAVG